MRLKPREDNPQPAFRVKKNLNFEALIACISQCFASIPSSSSARFTYDLHDILMGAFACMFFQHPSLLDFQRQLQEALQENNLFNLFRMTSLPKDTQFRHRLDQVDSSHYQPVFKALIQRMQRDRQLEQFSLPLAGGVYYVAMDGVTHHSSYEVGCSKCLTRDKKGQTLYQHQVLQSAIMHPKVPQVLPVLAEPIENTDGQRKQDCELNACKRLLPQLRQQYPRLPLCIGGDDLYANTPTIELANELDMRFVFTCKPDSHKFLFEWLQAYPDWDSCWHSHVDTKGRSHSWRWENTVPLHGGSDEAPQVNFLEYRMHDAKGNLVKKHSWVTDIAITDRNYDLISQVGRSRWKIENECFNSLKNQGYHLEHNFGHGQNHLSTNMYLSTLLAFLVHQILELTDDAFQQCRKRCGSKRSLWEKLRARLEFMLIADWYWLMGHVLDDKHQHFVLENVIKKG